MSWQERMRQMVLAGGVVVAGCSSGQLGRPDAAGTGGANTGTGGESTGTGGASTGTGGAGTRGAGGAGTGGAGTGGARHGGAGTGGAAGGAGRSGTGGSGGAGGTIFSFPCGNANPDPCICGRPDASASNAALCDQKMTCQKIGGVWTYSPGQVQHRSGCGRRCAARRRAERRR